MATSVAGNATAPENASMIPLREQVRTQAGKESTPSAAIIDSQSVKMTAKGGSKAMTRARKEETFYLRNWNTNPVATIGCVRREY